MANNKIITEIPDKDFYYTWDDKSTLEQALAKTSKALESSRSLPTRSIAGLDYRSYRNIEPNLSVRSSYSRESYDVFRPGEHISRRTKNLMFQCLKAYNEVGVIKNIIDLMADFTAKGIEVVHPDKKKQAVYRKWFSKINGKERSERFCSILYRLGTVIIKRDVAKVPIKTRRNLSLAVVDSEIPEEPRVLKYEIPWNYTFLNPLTLNVINEEIAPFVGEYAYQMMLSPMVIETLKKSAAKLPPFIANAITTSSNIITLPMDNISTYFYKKDDWQLFPEPILASVLSDIQMLEKMKLADLAALDGVISNVRIWKIGSLEHKILPSPAAIAKLSEMLINVGNGNTADLIWGPELSFEQHIPDVDKILGSDKYSSVMTAIYEGLGIPATLTAKSDKSGFSNNFIGLKIMIERLEYGRNILNQFWTNEFKLFQKAMGYDVPAKLKFGRDTLSDDVQEKALLIQLVDRDIVSVDTLQEIFGMDPDVEAARFRFEERNRKSGKMPEKTSPWHDPILDEKHENRLEEIALQGGLATPSQVGLDFDEPKKGEQTMHDLTMKLSKQKQPTKLKGEPQEGRPINSKDTNKRKRRTPRARTSAELDSAKLMLWAMGAIDRIDELVNPIFLGFVGKSNLRQLTKTEDKNLSDIKFALFSNLEPFSKIDEEYILNGIDSSISANLGVLNIYDDCIQNAETELTTELRKNLKALAFAAYYEE